MASSLRNEARDLIIRASDPQSGSLFVGIYDTAWLSMISSPQERGSWLFPECFQFVLDQQLENGAWPSYASHVDGILNTSAALLSLEKHIRCESDHQDWKERSQKAQIALKGLLKNWDVASTDHVGFKILVIKLFDILATEGVDVDFPQLDKLRVLYNKKLSKLPASSVYETRSTLHHSLEALIGHVDFVQMKRWQESDGSMLGSPASTAAYLMYSSNWDHQAESYLRRVLRYGPGQGSGGVPSAWPTSIFESAWAVTTLATAGLTVCGPEFAETREFFQMSLMTGNGVVGFSRSSLPDSDDTAKALLAMHYLGSDHSVEPLIQFFEAEDHFRTYQGERNPSFSANCNVLGALLTLGDPNRHAQQVMKVIKFIYSKFVSDTILEKWHLHKLYSLMLLAQAIQVLYKYSQAGSRWATALQDSPYLIEQTPMISLHILTQILDSQKVDGSWNGICEVTAYAVLALSSLLHLPWVRKSGHEEVFASVNLGKAFLEIHREKWKDGQYLWIEKVTYASNVLSEAYCLAAVLVPEEPEEWSGHSRGFETCSKATLDIMKARGVVAQTPLFSKVSEQLLRTAEIQACHAFYELERNRSKIFPKTTSGEDEYLVFIPLTWTACSVRRGAPVSLSVIMDMMNLSMLNYQVDEYMESMVERQFTGDLGLVRELIIELCSEQCAAIEISILDQKLPTATQNCSTDKNANELSSMRLILGNYISYILQHPAVLSCSLHIQRRLALELQTILLAHVTHGADNHRFQQQQNKALKSIYKELVTEYVNPGRSFYTWVHGISADHTSCPFSFVFFNCLINALQGEVYMNSKTAYVADDVARHLASLCRMYNDYGSVARDQAECNLNSVNFPEFHVGVGCNNSEVQVGLQGIMSELMDVAEYERSILDHAMKQLSNKLGSDKVMEAVALFVDVTDLYGQIYVQRDIGTPMERPIQDQ
ncbi:Ent-kaurene synthase [Xylariaceae sp. FL0255]|nr:Ent-kaurene synthase [Xylariaceae sp. FL0255]